MYDKALREDHHILVSFENVLTLLAARRIDFGGFTELLIAYHASPR